MNDLELLREYARDGTQEPFKTVVTHYVDLVYSAAKRQVRSPDLANEVVQAVFLDLATSVPKLRSDTCVASWLHVATRRRAIDVVRRESTRQQIERAAGEDPAVNASPTSWSQIEPLLDEALSALRADDRQAILLRFFQNQSLRDVGETLGCTEDTAQKRISRALDRLRGFFADRGLVTIAAVLASELSTHAVEPAPSGTAASIGSSVAAKVAAISARQALRASVLSALKVAAVTALLAGSAAWLGYRAYVLHVRRLEVVSTGAVADRWSNELRALRAGIAKEKLAAANALAPADDLVSADPDFDARMRSALAHLVELRRRFAADPRQQIPEMRLLKLEDWFAETQAHVAWDTEDGWRELMSSVRTRAINRSGSVLESALERYVNASHGQLPKSLDELGALCDPMLGPEVLARYELKLPGATAPLPDHAVAIAERNDAAVDPDHDNLAVVGLHWSGVTGVTQENSLNAVLGKMVEEAVAGYRAAHDGKDPASDDPEVLRPYFSDPQKGEAFVAIMRAIAGQLPKFKQENAAGIATNAYAAAHHGQNSKAPEDLVPYFKYPEDAAAYLKLVHGEIKL